MHDVSRLIFTITIFLNQITERKRLNSGNFSISARCGKEVSFLGGLSLTLQVHLFTSLASSLLGSLVGLDTLNNFLLTLGLTDVFNSDMDTLLKNTPVDKLVHTNTNGGLGHIENNTSTSVVVLVRHTLVDGRVGEDVNVVSNLHRDEVLGEVGQTTLAKFLREHVARTRSDTK